MKVLMICTEKLPLPSIRGGAIQTYIDGVLPQLKEHHEITVLGISDPDLPDKETLDDIQYVRIPGKVFEVYRDGVVQYLESQSFDFIHIFNRPRLILPVRHVAPTSKITLSMHNDMFKEEKINPEEATKALEEVSLIVTVSDYIGNVIRTQYPQAADKLHTIYSGVDTGRFLPGNHSKMKPIREALRREHGLENKTVILFAGRLSRNKGVDRLVRALPQLSKRFNNLALVIVGSKWFSQNEVTDYVAYVRALAKKLPIPVVNTGFVSPSDIQNWFAAADVFVCTSVWQEPLARVHYEAMAAGLPIVTTNRGGNAEVISLRENGLIIDNPEDPNQFVSALTELLDNPSLMKKMGEKGRELALTHYTWDRVSDDILKVWELANQQKLIQTESETQIEEVVSLESPVEKRAISTKKKEESASSHSTDNRQSQGLFEWPSLFEDFKKREASLFENSENDYLNSQEFNLIAIKKLNKPNQRRGVLKPKVIRLKGNPHSHKNSKKPLLKDANDFTFHYQDLISKPMNNGDLPLDLFSDW